MKLKLDENLGQVGTRLLMAAGHDVATVAEQGLASAPDPEVIRVCREEGRCLVTLDKDFCDVRRYPPADYPGIVLLRMPTPFFPSDLEHEMGTLLQALSHSEVSGKLWIIDSGRLRVFPRPRPGAI